MVDYNTYMNSPEWDSVRAEVLERARGCCERCGARARLEVHHKHYENLGDEDITDLEALCPDCHRQADGEREDEQVDRRFEAWAKAVYGSTWRDQDEDELQERFERFLAEDA